MTLKKLRRITGKMIMVAVVAESFLALSGCGVESDRPDLGEVTGVVLLDGAPLPNANISFRPSTGGRVSRGVTDESGHYQLIYLDNPREVRGAKVGENIVYVSTFLDEDDSGGPKPELVPPCYLKKEGVRRVEVKDGRNEINIELTSNCSQ